MKKIKSLLFNEIGMGLAEVLVAAAITGAISVVSMKSISTNLKATKTLESTTDSNYFYNEVSTILSNESACLNSFGGLDASSTTGITDIRDGDNTITISTNDKKGNVTLKSIALSDSGLGSPVVPGGTGYTNVVMVFDRGKDTYVTDRRKTILLNVTTDGSSNVTACVSAATGSSDLWDVSAVDTSDIYYDTGQVGIGVTDPQYSLDVDGSVNLLNNTNANGFDGAILKNGSPFLHNFSYDGSSTGNNTFLGIDSGNFGNLGNGSGTHQASYNTGVGYQALQSLTSGSYNTAFGFQALQDLTTGRGNTAAGAYALTNTTTATMNTALGYRSLMSNTTGINNTAIGIDTLLSSTTGSYNTAIGPYVLDAATIGQQNTAAGYNSMTALTTGSYNTAFSFFTMENLTTGSYNTASGHYSQNDVTTGSYNTSFGYNSLGKLTTGTNNTALGGSTTFNSPNTGSNNTSFGLYSLRNLTTGNENTAMGYPALEELTTGSRNIAIGHDTALELTTGTGNISMGIYSLDAATTANYSIALGRGALTSLTTVDYNIAVGTNTLSSNTTGTYNLAIGHEAMYPNSSGYNNVAIGYETLRDNSTGNRNVAIGHEALRWNESGQNNVAIGHLTMRGTSITGDARNNVAIGNQAFHNQEAGSSNVAIGAAALNTNYNGTRNLAIGTYAGQSVGGDDTQTPTGNIAVGSNAMEGIDSDLSDNVAENPIGGDYNVAFGRASMGDLDDGSYNIAIGAHAVHNNEDQDYNIGIGYAATRGSNATTPTGNHNVGIGRDPLYNYTTGSFNVAIGTGVLYTASTASNNVGVGGNSFRLTTTGSENVAIGYSASADLTTGANNVAVGGSALEKNSTGNSNVAAGYHAGRLTGGAANVTASVEGVYIGYNVHPSAINNNSEIVIGAEATGNGSNTVQLGNSSTTCMEIGAANDNFPLGACPSDKRLKKDILDMSFDEYYFKHFTQLRPVTYYFKKSKVKTTGFIAQEVEKVSPSLLGEKTDKGYLTVNYGKIKWMHFKSSQKIAKEINRLKKENELMQEAICEMRPSSAVCELGE